MSLLYNSDGSGIRMWDTSVETETELQRTRRRLQKGWCVACGTAERLPFQNLCGGCWEALRFCAGCERIIPKAQYRPNNRCKQCHAAYCRAQRARKNPYGETGRAAIDGARARANEAKRARGEARAAEIHRLRGRAWTWEEIARALDGTVYAVQKLYYDYYKGGKPRERLD